MYAYVLIHSQLVTPFTKPLSECKALLHTFVKYGFVKLFLQAPTFFFLFFRLHNNNKKIGKNLQFKTTMLQPKFNETEEPEKTVKTEVRG